MLSSLRDRVLPDHQRRTLEELEEDLDLSAGDIRAKQSAFWSMLFLSAVIAAGGELTDSTATVIGAMIVAPLSTPIMGIALGAVQRRRSTAALFVGAGGLLVVALGALFSLVLPSSYDLLSNSQISSRTSPGLMDLVAALATGFAGALALARRDVAAVLPGVAIAISLVPPLVVTGVCLGQAAWWLALGSFVLFVSNLLALVFAGMAKRRRTSAELVGAGVHAWWSRWASRSCCSAAWPTPGSPHRADAPQAGASRHSGATRRVGEPVAREAYRASASVGVRARSSVILRVVT
ncbi:DUF389 domain-containing protein [Streptomyces sp. CB02009]|uniref:DUF389 domain-containing protein n=1 Tax=Streptomyces sp. CB02009 TaxID=1703938 RepID=UPI001F5164EB|nr:DUF389 domain-containing protein [Streptomyces sp. CB02009]